MSGNPSPSGKKLEGADDYDVTMIKTDYITNIEVEQKGRLEDFGLPSISPSTIMRKEVGCGIST